MREVPCGSASTSSTLRPRASASAARQIASVLLPEPPFCPAMATRWGASGWPLRARATLGPFAARAFAIGCSGRYLRGRADVQRALLRRRPRRPDGSPAACASPSWRSGSEGAPPIRGSDRAILSPALPRARRAPRGRGKLCNGCVGPQESRIDPRARRPPSLESIVDSSVRTHTDESPRGRSGAFGCRHGFRGVGTDPAVGSHNNRRAREHW